jgi:hypothetical protein
MVKRLHDKAMPPFVKEGNRSGHSKSYFELFLEGAILLITKSSFSDTLAHSCASGVSCESGALQIFSSYFWFGSNSNTGPLPSFRRALM